MYRSGFRPVLEMSKWPVVWKTSGVVLIEAVIGPGIPRLRSLGDAAEHPHVLRPPVDLLMVAPDDFHVCVWKDFHPDGFPLEAIVSIPGAFNRRIIHKFSYGAKLVLSRCRQKIPPSWTAPAIPKRHVILIFIETLEILKFLLKKNLLDPRPRADNIILLS